MNAISVVIVTYCSDEYIKDCLDSIFLHCDLPDDELEVIVVDNSPSTSDFLISVVGSFSNTTLINNPKNMGFGQGNNVGADAACGKVLLFLNPDTKLIEPVFREAIDHLMKHPDVGAVGCRLIDGDGRSNDTYGYFPEKWNILVSMLDKCVFKPLKYIPKKSVYPWGANYFIARKDFYSAGKFDEDFFLCFEEADLCKRILPKRTHILNKKIIHYGGHTTDEASKRFDAWLESLRKYHVKHGYDLNRTLTRYRIAYYLPLVRCLITGGDYREFKRMINKLGTLKKTLAI